MQVHIPHTHTVNLTSTLHNLTASHLIQNALVNINVGGSTMAVTHNTQLTAAERMAVMQVLRTGTQTLQIGSLGNATGGSFTITPHLAQHINNLVIPQGVTAIARVTSPAGLSIKGSLIDAGTLILIAPSGLTTAIVSANNIIDKPGGVISTVLPAGGLTGYSQLPATLNLDLNALNNIVNAGTISSSGSLSLNAGGSIINAVHSIASTSTAVIQAANNISLSSAGANIVNSGLISAATGNINILSQIAQAPAPIQTLNFNNNGGTLQALNGSINVQSPAYSGNASVNLTGGKLLSNQLNLYSAGGNITINADQISGSVNASGNAAHVTTNSGGLLLGTINLTGDPTFYNDGSGTGNNGDITIGGNITVGEDLTIVASGNILTNGDYSITAQDAHRGYDINLIAGANISTTGTVSQTVGPGSGTSATWSGTGTVASNPVVISGASSSGGDIDFSANQVTINTSAVTSGQQGGNVRLIAYTDSGTGTNGGHVLLGSGTIATGGMGNGLNGFVNIVAGAADSETDISVGSIKTTGGTGGGGAINVLNSQPSFTTGTSLTFGTDGSITSGNDFNTSGTAGSGVVNLSNAYAAGAMTINAGMLQNNSGSILLYGHSITLNANVSTAGNFTAVASGNISSTNGLTITANDGAKGYDINLVAGANAVVNVDNSVTISGASTTGGDISFNSGASGDVILSSAASTGTNPGGNVRLIAYSDSGTGTNGGHVLLVPGSNSSITTSGSNGGSNGLVTIAAGDNNSTVDSAINVPSITTSGSTGGAGSVSIINSQPSFTSGSSLNFTSSGSISSANDFSTLGNPNKDNLSVGTISSSGAITIVSGNLLVDSGTITTAGGSVALLGNGLITTNGITTSGGALTVVGGSNSISLSNVSTKSAAGGGNVAIIAGASFTVSAGSVNITASSGNNTNVTGTFPIDSSSSAGAGGNITIVNFSGSPSSLEAPGSLTASGASGQANGNLLVVGNATQISISSFTASGGSSGGNVSLLSAVPTVSPSAPLTINLTSGAVTQPLGFMGSGPVSGSQAIIGAVNAPTGALFISSNSVSALAGLTVASALIQSTSTIGLGETISVGGPFTAVAAGTITGPSSIAANDGAKGYDINLIAGASSTFNAGSLTVNGPSTTGGDLNLGTISISSAATASGNPGGNIRLIAYSDSVSQTNGGHISLSPGSTITTSGNGSGLNGFVNIFAADQNADTAIQLTGTTITTTGGTGGGAVTVSNSSVTLTSGNSLTFGATGITTVNDFSSAATFNGTQTTAVIASIAAAGAVTLSAPLLNIANGATVASTSIGGVSVTASAFTSGGAINTSSTHGPVNITADSVWYPDGSVNAGTGTVTIAPLTTSTAMTIGGTRTTGLSLTGNGPGTELGNTIAGNLVLGSTNDSSTITVGGSLDITGTPGTTAGAYNLVFNTGGTFTSGGVSITQGTQSLTVNAQSGVTLGSISATSLFSIGTSQLNFADSGTFTSTVSSGPAFVLNAGSGSSITINLPLASTPYTFSTAGGTVNFGDSNTAGIVIKNIEGSGLLNVNAPLNITTSTLSLGPSTAVASSVGSNVAITIAPPGGTLLIQTPAAANPFTFSTAGGAILIGAVTPSNILASSVTFAPLGATGQLNLNGGAGNTQVLATGSVANQAGNTLMNLATAGTFTFDPSVTSPINFSNGGTITSASPILIQVTSGTLGSATFTNTGLIQYTGSAAADPAIEIQALGNHVPPSVIMSGTATGTNGLDPGAGNTVLITSGNSAGSSIVWDGTYNQTVLSGSAVKIQTPLLQISGNAGMSAFSPLTAFQISNPGGNVSLGTTGGAQTLSLLGAPVSVLTGSGFNQTVGANLTLASDSPITFNLNGGNFTNKGTVQTSAPGPGATITVQSSPGGLAMAGSGTFSQTAATPGLTTFSALSNITFTDGLSQTVNNGTGTAATSLNILAATVTVDGPNPSASAVLATANGGSILVQAAAGTNPLSFAIGPSGATSATLHLNGGSVVFGSTGSGNGLSSNLVPGSFTLASTAGMTFNMADGSTFTNNGAINASTINVAGQTAASPTGINLAGGTGTAFSGGFGGTLSISDGTNVNLAAGTSWNATTGTVSIATPSVSAATTGTLTASAGPVNVNTAGGNPTTFSVSGGSVHLNGSALLVGTSGTDNGLSSVNIQSGATLNSTGLMTFNVADGATFTNSGSVNGSASIIGQPTSGSATGITLAGGTGVAASGGFSASLSISDATSLLLNGNNWNVTTGNLSLSTPLVSAATAGTLTASSGSVNVNSAGGNPTSFQVSTGTVKLDGSSVTFGSSGINNGLASLNVDNGATLDSTGPMTFNLADAGTFTNNGTINGGTGINITGQPTSGAAAGITLAGGAGTSASGGFGTPLSVSDATGLTLNGTNWLVTSGSFSVSTPLMSATTSGSLATSAGSFNVNTSGGNPTTFEVSTGTVILNGSSVTFGGTGSNNGLSSLKVDSGASLDSGSPVTMNIADSGNVTNSGAVNAGVAIIGQSTTGTAVGIGLAGGTGLSTGGGFNAALSISDATAITLSGSNWNVTSGDISINSPVMNGASSGTLTAPAGAVAVNTANGNATTFHVASGTVNLEGTSVTFGQTGTNNGLSSVKVDSGATLGSTSNMTFNIADGGTFTNSGLVNGSATIAGQSTSGAAAGITLAGGTGTASSGGFAGALSITDPSAIALNGTNWNVTVSDLSISSAKMSATTSGTLAASSGVVNVNTANGNPTTFEVTSGTVNLNGTVNIGANGNNNGLSSLAVDTGAGLASSGTLALNIADAGSLTNNGTISGSTTIAGQPSSSTSAGITLAGGNGTPSNGGFSGGLTISDASALKLNGTNWTVTSGNLSLSTPLMSATSSGTLSVSSGSANLNATAATPTSFELTTGTVNLNASSVTVGTSGTGNGLQAATVDSGAKLASTGAMTFNIADAYTFTNNGIVSASSGITIQGQPASGSPAGITLNGGNGTVSSGAFLGNLTIADATDLIPNGNNWTVSSGSLSIVTPLVSSPNFGTFAASSINVNSSAGNPALFELNGGTLNLNGTVVFGTTGSNNGLQSVIVDSGITLASTGSLTFNIADGHALSNAGAINATAGVVISGQATTGTAAGITLTGGSGTAASGGFTGNLTINDGTALTLPATNWAVSTGAISINTPQVISSTPATLSATAGTVGVNSSGSSPTSFELVSGTLNLSGSTVTFGVTGAGNGLTSLKVDSGTSVASTGAITFNIADGGTFTNNGAINATATIAGQPAAAAPSGITLAGGTGTATSGAFSAALTITAATALSLNGNWNVAAGNVSISTAQMGSSSSGTLLAASGSVNVNTAGGTPGFEVTSGTVNLNGTALTVGTAGTGLSSIQIDAPATLASTAPVTFNVATGGTFTLNGTVLSSAAGGGAASINVQNTAGGFTVAGTGQFQQTGGGVQITRLLSTDTVSGITFANLTSLTLTGATGAGSGFMIVSPVLTLDPSVSGMATLTDANAGTFTVQPTLSGAGTLSFQLSGSYPSGTLNFNGANLQINAATSVAVGSGLTVSSNSDITVTTPQFNLGSGAVLNASGSAGISITSPSGSNLTIQAPASAIGTIASASGTVAITPATGQALILTASSPAGGTLELDGLATLTAGTAASINNGVNLSANTSLTLAGVFTGSTSLTITTPLLILPAAASITLGGPTTALTITSPTGSDLVVQALNGGSISISTGALLTVSAASNQNLTFNSQSGNATFSLSGSSISITASGANGSVTLDDAVTLSSNNNVNVSTPTLNLGNALGGGGISSAGTASTISVTSPTGFDLHVELFGGTTFSTATGGGTSLSAASGQSLFFDNLGGGQGQLALQGGPASLSTSGAGAVTIGRTSTVTSSANLTVQTSNLDLGSSSVLSVTGAATTLTLSPLAGADFTVQAPGGGSAIISTDGAALAMSSPKNQNLVFVNSNTAVPALLNLNGGAVSLSAANDSNHATVHISIGSNVTISSDHSISITAADLQFQANSEVSVSGNTSGITWQSTGALEIDSNTKGTFATTGGTITISPAAGFNLTLSNLTLGTSELDLSGGPIALTTSGVLTSVSVNSNVKVVGDHSVTVTTPELVLGNGADFSLSAPDNATLTITSPTGSGLKIASPSGGSATIDAGNSSLFISPTLGESLSFVNGGSTASSVSLSGSSIVTVTSTGTSIDAKLTINFNNNASIMTPLLALQSGSVISGSGANVAITSLTDLMIQGPNGGTATISVSTPSNSITINGESLTFAVASANQNNAGTTINLLGGPITTTSTNLTIDSNVSLSGDHSLTFNVNGGTLTDNGAISVNGLTNTPASVSIASTASLVLSGTPVGAITISGGSSPSISVQATTTLTANSSYSFNPDGAQLGSGATTISAGTSVNLANGIVLAVKGGSTASIITPQINFGQVSAVSSVPTLTVSTSSASGLIVNAPSDSQSSFTVTGTNSNLVISSQVAAGPLQQLSFATSGTDKGAIDLTANSGNIQLQGSLVLVPKTVTLFAGSDMAVTTNEFTNNGQVVALGATGSLTVTHGVPVINAQGNINIAPPSGETLVMGGSGDLFANTLILGATGGLNNVAITPTASSVTFAEDQSYATGTQLGIFTQSGGTIAVPLLVSVKGSSKIFLDTTNLTNNGLIASLSGNSGIIISDQFSAAGITVSGHGIISAANGPITLNISNGPITLKGTPIFNGLLQLLDLSSNGITISRDAVVSSSQSILIATSHLTDNGALLAIGQLNGVGIQISDLHSEGLTISGPAVHGPSTVPGLIASATGVVQIIGNNGPLEFAGDVAFVANSASNAAAVTIQDTNGHGVTFDANSKFSILGGNGQVMVASPAGQSLNISGSGSVGAPSLVLLATPPLNAGPPANLNFTGDLTLNNYAYLGAPAGAVTISGTINHNGLTVNSPAPLPAGFNPASGINQIISSKLPSASGGALLIITDPLTIDGNLAGQSAGGSFTPTPANVNGGTTLLFGQVAQSAGLNESGTFEQIGTKISTDTTPSSVYGWTNGSTTGLPENATSTPTGGSIQAVETSSTTFNQSTIAGFSGVHAGQNTNGNFFNLDVGNMVFNPTNNITVGTHEGNVFIDGGSVAFVMETGHDVAIYDLHDTHSGAVRVKAGEKTILLHPGQQVVLTRNPKASFETINPGNKIAYRNSRSEDVGNGIRAFIADFSMPTAITTVAPLKHLLTSPNPADRKLAHKLLKNAVVLNETTAANGAYRMGQ